MANTPPEVVVNRILGGAILVGVVVGGAVLIGTLTKRGLNQQGNNAPALPASSGGSSAPRPQTPSTSGGKLPAGSFPLKRGDVNLKVKELQQLILKMGGAAALAIANSGAPGTNGADGIFGSGTAAALKILGFNENLVTEADFKRLLAGGVSAIVNNPASTPASTGGGYYVPLTFDVVDNTFFKSNPVVRVVKSPAIVYKYPFTNSEPIRTFTTVGEEIGEHLGESYDANKTASQRWAKIRLKDTTRGWIFSGDIASSPRTKAAASSAESRTGSNSAYVFPPPSTSAHIGSLSGIQQVITKRPAKIFVENGGYDAVAQNTMLGSYIGAKGELVEALSVNGVRILVLAKDVFLK